MLLQGGKDAADDVDNVEDAGGDGEHDLSAPLGAADLPLGKKRVVSCVG